MVGDQVVLQFLKITTARVTRPLHTKVQDYNIYYSEVDVVQYR